MSYLGDAGVLPTPVATPSISSPTVSTAPSSFTPSGSYLSSAFSSPQNEQTDNESLKINSLLGAQQVYQSNADYANSFGGLAKNTFKGIGTGIVNTGKDMWGALTKPATPPVTSPLSEKNSTVGGDIAGTTINTYVNSLTDAKNRMNTWSDVARNQHSTALQKGVAAGEAGMGALNTFFAPIVAASKGAEQVPVLGPIATGINNIFGMIGVFGSDTLDGAVEALPVSQSTKDTIKPLAREMGALGAQIVLGAKSESVYDSLADKTNQFLDEVKSGVSVEQKASEMSAEQLPKNITPTNESPESTEFKPNVKGGYLESSKAPNVKPLDQAHSEYVKENGYKVESAESDTYTKQLADLKQQQGFVRDAMVDHPGKGLGKFINNFTGEFKKGGDSGFIDKLGYKESNAGDIDTLLKSQKDYQDLVAKDKEITSQIKEITPKAKDEAFLNKIGNKTESHLSELRSIQPDVNEEPSEIKGTEPLKPVESTGEKLPSTLASKVDALAVARKLQDSLGGLPEYNQTNWKEQGQFAADLVNNDIDKATRIAMGDEAPPAHILATAVFKAVEYYATKSGDADLIKDLAKKSTISTKSTRMGQEIGYLSQRDKLSPIEKIKEVLKARSKNVNPKEDMETETGIKKEMTKMVAAKETWDSFVKRIQCNY